MSRSQNAALSIVPILVCLQLSCSDQAEQDRMPTPSDADSANAETLMRHLREHFDDLHDVSMRFHHADPKIGGLIVFETSWTNGVMSSAQVVNNETNNSALSQALIDKFSAWQVVGMQGEYQTNLPIRIQLVGSDDPNFSDRALITGIVTDADRRPLHRARLEFSPRNTNLERVPDAGTNREGIFVRTLIPPGEWTLTCSFEDKAPVVIEGIMLGAGEHHKETIVMN